MNRSEALDRLVEDVRDRLTEVVGEALADIEEVRKESRDRRGRYYAARRTLAATEGRIAELQSEREALITCVAESTLEDDPEGLRNLREQYRDLRHQLEQLEDRAETLRGELADLTPNARAGESGELEALRVEMHLSGEVTGPARVAGTDLEEAKRRLSEAVETAVGALVKEHKEARRRTEDLNQRVAWLPEVRFGRQEVAG